MFVVGGVMVVIMPVLAMLDIVKVIHIDSIFLWILLYMVHVGGMLLGYAGVGFYVGRERAKQQWKKLGKEEVNDLEMEKKKTRNK